MVSCRGAFAGREEPNLGNLLDLVALGTVADVVKLDRNNRILVNQGLKRMREGKLTPGIRALFRAAGRDPAKAGSMEEECWRRLMVKTLRKAILDFGFWFLDLVWNGDSSSEC